MIPEPECRGGYPFYQAEEVVGIERFPKLMEWMAGQTMMLCQGVKYEPDLGHEVEACGGVAHGPVIYVHDLRRFLANLPVID